MTPERNDEDGSFLGRWSRRKLDDDAAEPKQEAAPQPAAVSGEDDEARRLELQRNREEAEAIDLAALDSESDYAPFFKAGVPKALKSAALKALWRSSPVFANLDGLNDYDENFADPALIKKFAGSAWQVGKGYLRDEPDPPLDPSDAETEPAGPAAAGKPADEPVAEPVADDLAAENPATDPATDPDEKIQPAQADAEPGPDERHGARHDEPESRAESDPVAPDKIPLRSRLGLDDWDAG